MNLRFGKKLLAAMKTQGPFSTGEAAVLLGAESDSDVVAIRAMFRLRSVGAVTGNGRRVIGRDELLQFAKDPGGYDGAHMRRKKYIALSELFDGMTDRRRAEKLCRKGAVKAAFIGGQYVIEARQKAKLLRLMDKPKHRMLTFNGKTMTIQQWADRKKITKQALHARLNRHSVDEALTMPNGDRRSA